MMMMTMTLMSPSRPEVMRSRRMVARARVKRLLSRKEEVVTEKFLSFRHFSLFCTIDTPNPVSQVCASSAP